jgi:hypothetical protein
LTCHVIIPPGELRGGARASLDLRVIFRQHEEDVVKNLAFVAGLYPNLPGVEAVYSPVLIFQEAVVGDSPSFILPKGIILVTMFPAHPLLHNNGISVILKFRQSTGR